MDMRLFSILAVVALTVLVSGCTQSNESPNTGGNQAENSVNIRNFAFSPSQINIKVGDTITWTNSDTAPHTVTSDSGSELDSPTISVGQTYSHTFANTGTFDYYCTIHPSMKGKVVVE
jgi:amicyanin